MNLASSIITLEPGMYILRHPKTGMPPISISRAPANPAHNGQIQALYTPGSDASVLRDRRDCIVMQVLNAPVDLLVTAYLDKVGAAVPALQLDKIQLEGDTPAKTVEIPATGISLIGHIERTGDVLAEPGKTLGGAEGDLRVEGFQVMWPDKPKDIDLAYSVNVEGSGELQRVHAGEFCGTRNAARRIVGVTFELEGKRAEDWRIDGEAQFSGGFKSPIEAGTAVQGPSGMEHLTALRLTVVRKNLWTDSPRTRVMKGRGRK